MSIKKKGTPEKIEIVIESNDLEKWRKLIEEATTSDTPFTIVKKGKETKGK